MRKPKRARNNYYYIENTEEVEQTRLTPPGKNPKLFIEVSLFLAKIENCFLLKNFRSWLMCNNIIYVVDRMDAYHY